MQNKLQELTDKLYNEGLSKGKQEGEAIVREAKAKADGILSAARKEAEDIVSNAMKEADELRAKVAGDLKMAASQSIAATKQDIERLIVAKIDEQEVRSAMSSADFIREIITEVARNFNPASPADLETVLPESLKKELEPFVKKELASILKSGIEAKSISSV